MATTTTTVLGEEIARVNRQFEATFNAGDFAGAARAVYTQDAHVLPPGAPHIEGREAIAGFWDAAARQMGIRAVRLATVALMPLGDAATEIGAATLDLTSGQQVEVKYVVIWQQENGAWKWHVDIWNANA